MLLRQVFEHYQQQDRLEGEFNFCPFCTSRLTAIERGGRSRAGCPSCGFVQYRNPAPAVGVLVVDRERVLLGRRAGEPGKGTWALPSGYVEYEDDFLSTAIREAKEETGLDVEIRSVIHVVSSFVSPRFHFLTVYVVARVVGGEAAAGDDLETIAWFPVKGPLPEMGFAEDAQIIEMYRNGFEGIPVDPGHARPDRRGWRGAVLGSE